MRVLALRIIRAIGVALFAVVVGFYLYAFVTNGHLEWRGGADFIIAAVFLIVVAFALRLAYEGFRPKPELRTLDQRPGVAGWIASGVFGIIQAGIMAWIFTISDDSLPKSTVLLGGGAIAFFVTFMITRTVDGLAWLYSAIRGAVLGVARRGRVIDRASAAATGSRRPGPRTELVK